MEAGIGCSFGAPAAGQTAVQRERRPGDALQSTSAKCSATVSTTCRRNGRDYGLTPRAGGRLMTTGDGAEYTYAGAIGAGIGKFLVC